MCGWTITICDLWIPPSVWQNVFGRTLPGTSRMFFYIPVNKLSRGRGKSQTAAPPHPVVCVPAHPWLVSEKYSSVFFSTLPAICLLVSLCRIFVKRLVLTVRGLWLPLHINGKLPPPPLHCGSILPISRTMRKHMYFTPACSGFSFVSSSHNYSFLVPELMVMISGAQIGTFTPLVVCQTSY